MKKNKIEIIFIIIVVAIAIIVGIYKIVVSYIFKGEKDIDNGHENLIEKFKNIENEEEKESKVRLYLENNKITQNEAKEILGE